MGQLSVLAVCFIVGYSRINVIVSARNVK